MQKLITFVLFALISLVATPAFAADGICGADGCTILRVVLGLVVLGLFGLAIWGIVCVIRGRAARICRETDARRRRLADLEAAYRYAFALHQAGPTADTFRRLVFARGDLVAEFGPAIQAVPNGGLLEPLPVWPPAPGGAAPAAPPAP